VLEHRIALIYKTYCGKRNLPCATTDGLEPSPHEVSHHLMECPQMGNRASVPFGLNR